MSLSQLQFLNNEVQVILANKDFSNATLRANLRQAKLLIYSNPNFEGESDAYLKEASTILAN
jgi:hypothetical protein